MKLSSKLIGILAGVMIFTFAFTYMPYTQALAQNQKSTSAVTKDTKKSSAQPEKILATFISWAWLLFILFFIHPNTWQNYYYTPFFVSLFISILMILSFFFKKPLIFILIPLGCVAIIAIRIFLIKDYINPLLIIGLVSTLIYFFTSNSPNAILTPKSNLNNQSKPYADLPQTNRPESGKGN